MKTLLSAAFAAMVTFAPALADEGGGADRPGGGSIAVRGHGVAAVPPDEATLDLVVYSTAASLGEVAKVHAGRTAAAEQIIASLATNGVEIGRSALSTGDREPDCAPAGGASCPWPASARFFAETDYHVVVHDLANLDKGASAMVASSLFRLNSQSYAVKDEAAAIIAAHKAAVLDARARAEAEVGALGIRLGAVRAIRDAALGNGGRSGPMPMMALAKAAGPNATQPEFHLSPPKTLDFEADVDVEWQIDQGK